MVFLVGRKGNMWNG